MQGKPPPKSAWPLTLSIDVDMCPRCAGRHDNVEFMRFELGDAQYTHWAYCKATGEPLLLDMRRRGVREPDKFWVRFMAIARAASPTANPAYPDGVDVVPEIKAGNPSCKCVLPYPATGFGAWKVECTECGARLGCTATGRSDDPRSITIPCQGRKSS